MITPAYPLQYFVSFSSGASNKTFSRYFSFMNPLRARELALCYFLETVLDDEFSTDQDFCSMYLHHTSSRECVEIINSCLYDNVVYLEGAKRELELFRAEGKQAPVAVYDTNHPAFVVILKALDPGFQNTDPCKVYILADDYGVFLKGKKEHYMIA